MSGRAPDINPLSDRPRAPGHILGLRREAFVTVRRSLVAVGGHPIRICLLFEAFCYDVIMLLRFGSPVE